MFKITEVGDSENLPDKQLLELGRKNNKASFGYYEKVGPKFDSIKFYKTRSKQIEYIESLGYALLGDLIEVHKVDNEHGETLGWKGVFEKHEKK